MTPTQQIDLRPIALIVLDGVGIAQTSQGNAVTKARTPFLEKAWDSYPHTFLQAAETAVGLPPGIKGNSEVGHMNLGSGRVVYQDLPRINRAIERGSFDTNQEFVAAVKHTQQYKSKIHVAVCFSDAGVHGTTDHLEAFLHLIAKHAPQQQVIIHAFTDGRDTPPKSAELYFQKIESLTQQLHIGIFGTVMGRYYAMDRNECWDRIEKAYIALTQGTGQKAANWKEALEQAYQRGETDEFIQPTVLTNSAQAQSAPTVQNNDAFILLNYRSDRAIELTSAFLLDDPQFTYFNRQQRPQNIFYVGMAQYAKGLPEHIAFPSEDISLPLGRILAENDARQLRIAESEKFPHVTYFFNGGRAIKFNGEDRVEVPSPDVPTYDQKPEMSLPEVTQILLEKISLRIYDFILFNIANGDMVGHTGVLEAGKSAMEAVDQSVSQITKAISSIGGTSIVTADHGNIEEMINPKTHGEDTEHSLNPVPFILIPPKQLFTQLRLSSGVLADVTPTILDLLNIPKPEQMTGQSLV